MQRRTFAWETVAGALFLLTATDAAAIAQRTFVSTSGVDNSACSIVAPCRSFGAAVTVTSSGGEVIVLDSGGYGGVTITQAVSIIAPTGVYAGISVFAANNGVSVSAGPADTVVLRGLTINGQGGDIGIRVTSGNVIQIEDCTVAEMGSTGIRIEGGATVNMARLVVRGNGGGGVRVEASAAVTITTTLADSTLTNNSSAGFFAVTTVPGSTVNAALSRVTSSHNASSAFVVNTSGTTGTIVMTVADSIGVENAGNGVAAIGTNATVIVSGSSLVRNTLPDLGVSLGVLRTAGNNAVTGRGVADIFGTLTANPLK